MITDKDFLERGYTRYERSAADGESVVCLFQKRVDDEAGKKYFITVSKHAPLTRDGMEIVPACFEFGVNLTDKVNENPVNINMYSGWTIEDAEARAEEFWNMGVWNYYETWDEA